MKIVPVILSGGAGTRLWPASRPGLPKQYLSLLSGPSLIRATFDRILPLASVDTICVVTVEGHENLVAGELDDLSPEQIWSEPQGRNTGPSISWALHELQAAHAGDVAVFFPADHLVGDPERLRQAVLKAAQVAHDRGAMGLLGVSPEGPETGYGYVEAPGTGDPDVRTVTRFLEKPDRATAISLLDRPDIFWNSGIFVIPVRAGIRAVRQVAPDLGHFLDMLPAPGLGRTPDGPERAKVVAAFNAVQASPFDIAVMEKARDRILVPLDAGWSDLGTWQAVWEAGHADADGNVVGRGGQVRDANNCLVLGDGRTVAVLGVSDLVVVAFGDAVLVCPRQRAQDVRNLLGSRK